MRTQSTFEILSKSYKIICQIRHRASANKYQLNFDTFYLRWGKKIPTGKGYEIEVLNHDQIVKWHQKERKLIKEDGELANLHIHNGDDLRPYVCYPLQIKTKKDAIRLHKEWSRIMFAQIFFGLSDSFLFEKTNSDNTTDWSNFIDKFLEKKKLKIEDQAW